MSILKLQAVCEANGSTAVICGDTMTAAIYNKRGELVTRIAL